jgi:hypothetical protein
MSSKEPLEVSSGSEIESHYDSASKSDDNESSSDSEAYVVELILRQRKDYKGRRSFLVKWEGYDSSENTWVKEEDLNCKELLEEFLKKEKMYRKAIAPKGRLISKPSRILKLTKGRKGIGMYEVEYPGSNKSETLSSLELFKIDPEKQIDFLESVSTFPIKRD